MNELADIHNATGVLFYTAIVFTMLAIGLLLFIIAYLFLFKKTTRKDLRLADRFFTLVSEISICETEEELKTVIAQPYVQDMRKTCLTKQRRRAFMVKALLQYHKSINGRAADNIKWMYEKLELKKDALAQLSSLKWHKKAFAIQVLAEMGQQDCITKIYRYTNHASYHIRSEAQIAVVKLTGFDGLRFLNVISQPIAQWQQLRLLQQLTSYNNFQEDKLQKWLQSDNITVIDFALKLIRAYGVFTIHDILVECLTHTSASIRKAVILTLKETAQPHTPKILEEHFHKAEREEQLELLNALQSIGTIAQLPFLTQLRSCSDTKIKNEVENTIEAIDPDYLLMDCQQETTYKTIAIA